MNKVWLVTNFDKNEVLVFEKYPYVRKYRIENHLDDFEVEELSWHYKNQLVELMNKLIQRGVYVGSICEDEDDNCDEPDDDPMWADADALASAGHGMDEDYM